MRQNPNLIAVMRYAVPALVGTMVGILFEIYVWRGRGAPR
jgi:presenilin-like A22 family membrane protease